MMIIFGLYSRREYSTESYLQLAYSTLINIFYLSKLMLSKHL